VPALQVWEPWVQTPVLPPKKQTKKVIVRINEDLGHLGGKKEVNCKWTSRYVKFLLIF
jgi:hypothetical protein